MQKKFEQAEWQKIRQRALMGKGDERDHSNA